MNIRMASLFAMLLLLGCGILVLAQDSRQPTSAKKDVGLKADVKKAPTRKVSRQADLDGQQQNITSRYKSRHVSITPVDALPKRIDATAPAGIVRAPSDTACNFTCLGVAANWRQPIRLPSLSRTQAATGFCNGNASNGATGNRTSRTSANVRLVDPLFD